MPFVKAHTVKNYPFRSELSGVGTELTFVSIASSMKPSNLVPKSSQDSECFIPKPNAAIFVCLSVCIFFTNRKVN